MSLARGLPLILSEAHDIIRNQHACLNEQSHQINEQSTLIGDQEKEINYLKEQLRLAKMKLFGRSSERFVDPHDPQYQLFDEMPAEDAEQNDGQDDDTTEVSKHKRKRGKRSPLPDILERTRIEHTLPESSLFGPNGEKYEKIGEIVSEQLEIIPAQVKVTANVRFKYAVKGREELGVLIAPVANQPIPKSIASASMLAHIAQSKYEYHLPLYRQERIWASLGIDIPRNSMCRWMMKVGNMLEPLNKVMFSQMKSHGHMHVDETPVTVLENKNTKGSHKGYMWVYANHHGVLYDYRPTRSGSAPLEMLDDYGGYVQTDRYNGYNALFSDDKRISVACMAHARRKFADIEKACGKSTNGICKHVLIKMQELYKIERHARQNNFSTDEILQIRQSKAIPILNDLHQYLLDKQDTIPPKSGLGKAVSYFLNHYQALKRYTDSGIVSIDNNVAERAIKPFAVGRKNWLFCGNTAGAIAAANIYSLIEAAKMYNLKIFDYLKYVFEQLPNTHTQEDLIKLLPIHAQHYLPQMPTKPN